MTPQAIFFGAIGTLTETSDLQRRAFNMAFQDAGLDWVWDQQTYFKLLHKPGGQARIARYAEEMGVDVDASALHRAKVSYFAELAGTEGLLPRPGVSETIAAARSAGIPIGFVTTTGADTVSLIFSGLSPHILRSDFSYIGARDKVNAPKPASDIYHHALQHFDIRPTQAIAIEDTPESAEAAVSAGIQCIAFPGQAAKGRAFPDTCEKFNVLKPDLFGLTAKAA
ncbi:HAD-IA family hydrolase [Pseudaestuariivita rosea]|uniref:HAD-IA family hydrolase n=1 Tax=Pseudaestuariivita rosea TaxID=2763263 RepID=UPI001ABA49CC|nr:HAD-IA family hydrolase [Pseudaestuariivita rosea]